MIQDMRESPHRSATESRFVPLQPRIGSFAARIAIGPAFINMIDYLLLLLIPAETPADCGFRQECGDPAPVCGSAGARGEWH